LFKLLKFSQVRHLAGTARDEPGQARIPTVVGNHQNDQQVISWPVMPVLQYARMTTNQPWWLRMPPVELAATVLPLFSYSSRPPVPEWGALAAIAAWCRTGSYHEPQGSPGGVCFEQFRDPDLGGVAEAIQVLEHAGLLLRSGGEPPYVGLTRMGWHALRTNTVRQLLGLGDAPPMTI
jgi:hypothetical protein